MFLCVYVFASKGRRKGKFVTEKEKKKGQM